MYKAQRVEEGGREKKGRRGIKKAREGEDGTEDGEEEGDKDEGRREEERGQEEKNETERRKQI